MTRKNSRPDVFHSTHDAFTLPVMLHEVLRERYQNGVDGSTPFSTKIQEMFFADVSICSAVAKKVNKMALVQWPGTGKTYLGNVVHIQRNGDMLVLVNGTTATIEKGDWELVGEVEDNVR